MEETRYYWTKQKFFKSELWVQSYDFLKLAYDAKFCLHYHFRPNVCGIDENIQIEITIYPQREGRFSKTIFYFTDTYLLFSKMPVKSLKSQAEIDFFSKWSTAFLGPRAVENIRISSFIVKTKNLTKNNS